MASATAWAVLPHSLELERAILNAALEWGRTIANIDPVDFFRGEHSAIAAAIVEAQRKGLSTEYQVIRQILRARGRLDHVNEVYLRELARDGICPSERGIVSSLAHLRELACGRLVATIILNSAEHPADIDLDALIRDLERIRTASGAATRSAFRTAKDVAATSERVEWIVRGYVARGAITELTGKAKLSGKTTLIAHLVAAVLDGSPCLGGNTQKGPVIYLTEQTQATFREVLRRAGLFHREDLSILTYWDVKGMSWPAIIEIAGREADRIGASLVVVDTLAQFAGIKGDGENNSGDAHDALAPLQQLAHRGKGLLVSRHARKSGGEVGEDGRGSSAFTGGVDIVLSLKRPEGKHRSTIRLLEGLSRFDETPRRLAIEKVSALSPSLGIDGWAESFQVLGETEAVATDAARAGLEEHMPNSEASAMTLEQLAGLTGSDRSSLQRALKRLPGVQTIGKGKRGDPLRYFRSEIVSAQTSITGGLNGQKGFPEVSMSP